MRSKSFIISAGIGILFSLISCNSKKSNTESSKNIIDKIADKIDAAPEEKVPEIKYSFMKKADWMGMKDSFEGAKHLDILIALNRVDSSHLNRLDSILVPDRYDLELDAYLPFPKKIELLKDVKKIIIFSNPVQAFAAYENGKLVLQGQTNMGKKASPTPPKLYFCNWKAKKTISTSNSEWILKWNFNISNFGGIGFHQYAMPGYPASHSCIRLLASHAYFLYNWAEQWVLDGDNIVAHGTPVIVDKTYPFDEPGRPWHKLVADPLAMTLNQDSMKRIIEPHLETILQKQQERDAYKASKDTTVAL